MFGLGYEAAQPDEESLYNLDNEQPLERQRLLLIIGMYRSGTSATTLALTKLGYYPGPARDLSAPDEHNSEGYWENNRMMEFNDHLLAQFGLHAFSVRGLPSDWDNYPITDILSAQAAYLIDELFAKNPFAGWKDPRTTPLLPFYLSLLEKEKVESYFMLPIRNPLHVASSLHRKDQVPFTTALGLWTQYVLTALKYAPAERLHIAPYEKLLADPRIALGPMFDRFPFPKPSDARWAEARSAVRHNLSRAKAADGGLRDFPFVGKVYEAVLEMAENSGTFAAGGYRQRIDDLWQTWSAWGQLLAQVSLPSAVVSAGGPESESFCVPSCQWTPFRLRVHGPAGQTSAVTLGREPGIIYLRNPLLKSASGRPAPFECGFGPDGKSEVLPNGLIRVIIYSAGRHLFVRLPNQAGSWFLEGELFAQLGHPFMRDPLIGLLRRAGLTKAARAERPPTS